MFTKAIKRDMPARLALSGGSGSGKTYGALVAATILAPGGRYAVVDTEAGSAALYADRFDFDVKILEDHCPTQFTLAIHEAVRAGYDVLILDSLSHAWMGTNGVLEQVDVAKQRARNQLSPWKEPKDRHNAMVQAILHAPIHIITTMRAKTDHVLATDPDTKKQTVQKLSNQAVQEKDMEFEFTLMLTLDRDGTFVVDKSRCYSLVPNTVYRRTQLEDVLREFSGWLGSTHGALIAKLSEIRTELRNASIELPGIGTAKSVQAKSEAELEGLIAQHEALRVAA